MKRWSLSASVRLWFLVSLSGCLSAIAVQPGWAKDEPLSLQQKNNTSIPQLGDIELPATSAKLLVQQPAPTNPNPEDVIAITGVKANPTEKGVEVILETTTGDKLQVANRSTGNNFIADITGGQLRLPDGDAFTFKSEKPIEGITEITVTNIDANTVRVTVVGDKVLPAVELYDDGMGLFYVGARQGDLNNSFQLGDYFRTDASLYYRRGRLNAAINIRNLFDIDAVAYAGSRTFAQRTEPFTIVGSISWEF
jgi:iron complex outermembrane receptor protein